MSLIRINKLVRETGLFSRREADKAIEDGRVHINKKVAKPGDQVKADDVVRLDGEIIDPFKKNKARKKGPDPAVNPKSRDKRAQQKLANQSRRKSK